MAGDLFSREEILGGLHGSRARKLLFWIETRVAYMVFQTREALNRFLGEHAPAGPAGGTITELTVAAEDRKNLTLATLERYAPHWQTLVPPSPKTRATLINLLDQKYHLSRRPVPRLRAALTMDDPAVQQAYQQQYHRPLPDPVAPPQEAPAESPPRPHSTNLEQIEAELEWVRLSGGELLFEQGQIGDSLYILINGRLRAVTHRDDDDAGEHVADIGRYDIVGESSLLAGTPRSASVYAVRDSELLKFSRRSLERLAQKNPPFMLQLVQRLAGHYYGADAAPDTGGKLKTLALLPAAPGVPLPDVTRRLVAALSKLTTVLHLTPAVLDDALGAGSAQTPHTSADDGRIAGWLSRQEADYNLLLYEASAELTPWTRRCVRQADRVLIIANAGDDPAPGRLETALLSPRPAHAAPGLELLLLHPDKSRPPARTERWLAPRQVAQHHHLARNTPADFDRLARFLTGRAIGIVFSGGVFRGFAHGGVIKALQEVGLRPDFVGGTSIGAAIGALYALDWPFEKILARGKGFAAKARSYADLTLPLVSMISSRRLNRLSQELFGDTRIEDMWTPYFCVSSNLSRATMMVHRRGLLWRSVRASFALPTLLPPVSDEGDILVDGSLFDNLPAETMRQLCRDGPVIAVNVSPKKDLTRRYHFDAGLSGGQLLWSRLNPFAQEIKAPSLLTTVMRTIVVGRDESWPQAARDIDLYLEPPVVQYDFGDAGSLEYIIQASYEFARPKLMAWKGLLQARGLLA